MFKLTSDSIQQKLNRAKDTIEPLFNWALIQAGRILSVGTSLYISLAVILFLLGLSPIDSVSTIAQNLIGRAIDMLAFSVAAGLAILSVDKYSTLDLAGFLRDLMTRVYSILAYLLFQVLILFTGIGVLQLITEDSELVFNLESTGRLWIGFTILTAVLAYSIRLLPWIRAHRKRFQSWLKGNLLPPYDEADWHFENPIASSAQTRYRVYSPINVGKIQKQNLAPVLVRAIPAAILAPAILGVEIWLTSVLPPNTFDVISNSNFDVTRYLSGLGLFGTVLVDLIATLGLSGTDFVIIVLAILVPGMVQMVATWNLLYFWEECQYRMVAHFSGNFSASAGDDLFLLLTLHFSGILWVFLGIVGALLLAPVFPLIVCLCGMFVWISRSTILDWASEEPDRVRNLAAAGILVPFILMILILVS